jgi:hypothetical protein
MGLLAGLFLVVCLLIIVASRKASKLRMVGVCARAALVAPRRMEPPADP